MGFGYFMYSHSLVPVIDPKGVRVVTKLVSELWLVSYDFGCLCQSFLVTTTVIRLLNVLLLSLPLEFRDMLAPLLCFDFGEFVFSE